MTLDIAALVAPLSDEAPSGPDLGYDDERTEIEAAFSRSISVDANAEDQTDWRRIISLIVAQSARTRDMWLPVYLMRAAAASKQFETLVDGAELLAGLLEERWADVHPQLDEYGFIGRKAPCESLTRLGDFLAPLSRVPLIEHARFGRFSGEDLIRFRDEGASAEGYGAFRRALEGLEPDVVEGVAGRLTALVTAIRRADGVMTANAEGDTATNFKPTYDMLEGIRGSLAAYLPQAQSAISAGAVDDGAASGGGEMHDGPTGNWTAPSSGPAFSGAVRSRADVVRALDAICAYYSAFEPSSPVPLALTRAREWIDLDFMAVLQDIAPGSLSEATLILRSRRSEAEAAAAALESERARPAPQSDNSGW